MEDEARRRKERLSALRSGAAVVESKPVDIIKTLVYEQAEEQEPVVAKRVVGSESIFAGDKTLEDQVAFLLAEAKSLPSQSNVQGGSGEVTLEDLAPKKVNWDLKQDYEKRTEALRREYDRACIELIHKRLAEEAEET